MTALRLAIGFLTTIPVRAAAAQPADLGRAAAWFTLVGLVLGLALSGAHWLLRLVFPPALAAGLLVALWAAMTGGLHLDGLADCGDGLLAAASPERRLEIMRDPRLGSFGGIALVLFLLLKVLAVAALPSGLAALAPAPASGGAWLLVAPLVVSTVVARWLIVLAARQPAARPGGLGAAFAAGLRPASYLWAAALMLLVVALSGPRAWLAAGAAHLAAWGAWALARNRLGGLTGDVLGLTVELAELAVLLTYAAQWPAA